MTNVFIVPLLAVLLMGPVVASAGASCRTLFEVQSAAVRALVQPDAYMQWLHWEQTANLEIYRKSGEVVALPVARLKPDQVDVKMDPSFPAPLARMFVNDSAVLWVKHPHNKADAVPFRHEKETRELPAHYTASRSMGLVGMLRGFTIKVPTDHPHGPAGEIQRSKAKTADDVLSALLHSKHIQTRDRVLGPDEVVIILPEVLTVADKITKHGYVVRDVRQLDDGNYYLPALSIPYVGREIARLNGREFTGFWKENYARLLGDAKARLLLRYGLQMETPNPQNMLIQLDRNLRPTGKIAFRDVSDAFFVNEVAQVLGFGKNVARDARVDYKPKAYLQPYAQNSMWRLDQAGEFSLREIEMKSWKAAHNYAFTAKILKELGAERPDLLKKNIFDDGLGHLYLFLRSPEGQKLLAEYAAKKRVP